MFTFQQKHKPTQNPKSESLRRSRRSLQANREGNEASADIAPMTRFDHDFSQIPIHTPATGTAQTKQSGNGARDGRAHRADRTTYHSAGKLAAPLTEEEPWPEISGNGGPGVKPAGTVAAGAAPTTPPKLSKKKVKGPTASDCGGFKWVIQWELDKNTTKGGWVVQKVELPYDVKDCSNKPVDPKKVNGLQPSWYPLWEAWQINKGQKVTTYAETGDREDDTYATSGPNTDTKGSVTVKGTAEFYDGLTLPSSFKVTNKAPTWILPATKSAPTLSGGTGAISHNLTATWDCCSKGKTATRKTKIVTV